MNSPLEMSTNTAQTNNEKPYKTELLTGASLGKIIST